MAYKKLWIALGLVLIVSFAVLGGVGSRSSRARRPFRRRFWWLEGRPYSTAATFRTDKRLAIDRRPGGWHRLGPRIVRGARLVGRLAASRMHVHPGPLGSGGGRLELRGARRGTAGGPPGAASTADADQYL